MHDHRCMTIDGRKIDFDEFNALLRQKIMNIAGIDDVSGFELYSSLRMLANMFDAFLGQNDGETGISTARMGILVRLMMDESLGIKEPLTPTALSRFQNVSKNTISSLIRGLEDQGLVTRELDREDKRVFRLKITEEGKKLVVAETPRTAQYLNMISSDLSKDEIRQLIGLLQKLRDSMIKQAHKQKHNKDFHDEPLPDQFQ
jgi:DNA-binding MarR family transcriptional regulator